MNKNKKALLGALLGSGMMFSMGAIEPLGSIGRYSPVVAPSMPLTNKGKKARKKAKAASKARNKNRK